MIKNNYKKTIFMWLFLLIFCNKVAAERYRPDSVNELITDIILANSNGENDVIDLGGCEYVIENIYPGTQNGLPAIKPDNLLTTSSHSLTIKDGTIEISLLSGITARHFEVNVGASLYLENVTLKYGSSAGDGGSIANSGFLSLKYVAIFGNTAAASGGAIENEGSMSIGDSTFSQNTAINGGAIDNSGGTINQLFNSTFANNSASSHGGAIYNNGLIKSMTNNTIAANTAITRGGGIDVSSGTVNMFVSNIVAANDAPSGPDIFNLGTITNPQFNLIGIAGAGSGNNIGGNNLVGSVATPLDPGLEPLAYNGGHRWTMALSFASPAINTGSNPFALIFDERGHGYKRTSAGATDIGAYELQICELDSDHDGVCNENDNCPCRFNPSQDDCNHNGVGDACDECPCPCDREPCDDTCGPCPPHHEPGPCDPDDCHRCPREDDGRDGGHDNHPPHHPGSGCGDDHPPCGHDGDDCHRCPHDGDSVNQHI